jgi:ATP adenylyltransferase
MDYLWSPWRYRYVTSAGAGDACIFCAAASGKDDHSSLVAYRGRDCFVILNRYPYTSGHLMVVPYAHVATLESLTEQAAVEMALLVRQAERHLRELYKPEGLNVGINIGKAAGAGIAEHVHAHVLPRWTADANFMTTVGETRVIPEDLEETYRKVAGAFAAVKK